jgi:succinate-semialdehyde dehydrogenase/glutarate-semialdehyde dehydrogenase
MDKPTITLARNKCYVDGRWIGEPKVPVTNKATGDIIARVPDFGEAETRAAIDAASRAFPAWSRMLARDRSRRIRTWYDLIMANADELALLLTNEQGKPLAEARGEIVYAASFIEFFAEEAKRVYGETIPSFKADARIVVIRQPVGVVAAITPWNFPAAMITRKAGPALAVGCTMVVKPASETPLTALALAALAEEAGIPRGVFNVITGKASVIGKELTSNPDVRMLTFTGSTEIGAKLMAQCAPTVKKLGLELGGNAPFIVFDDADLGKAVQGAMASKYRNAGQTCVCANRIYVQDGVYDAFAEKLAAEVRKMKVGPGTEEGVTTGPLINKAAVDKVEEHLSDALGKGAKVILGGKRHALGGNFYEPTILADVTADMLVAREETFGPVAPLFRF